MTSVGAMAADGRHRVEEASATETKRTRPTTEANNTKPDRGPTAATETERTKDEDDHDQYVNFLALQISISGIS